MTHFWGIHVSRNWLMCFSVPPVLEFKCCKIKDLKTKVVLESPWILKPQRGYPGVFLQSNRSKWYLCSWDAAWWCHGERDHNRCLRSHYGLAIRFFLYWYVLLLFQFMLMIERPLTIQDSENVPGSNFLLSLEMIHCIGSDVKLCALHVSH